MTEKNLQLLLEEFHVPAHIRAHMKKVAGIAVFIGKKLIKKGGSVDLKSLEQAALLHDMVKLCDFKELKPERFQTPYTEEDLSCWKKLIKEYHHVGHVHAAYEILKQRGEEKIATIIKKHRFSCLIDPNENERPVSWEEKILYYADKRVKHDQIVTIKKRVEDGRKRYFPDGKVPANDEKIYQAILSLEHELSKASGINLHSHPMALANQ